MIQSNTLRRLAGEPLNFGLALQGHMRCLAAKLALPLMAVALSKKRHYSSGKHTPHSAVNKAKTQRWQGFFKRFLVGGVLGIVVIVSGCSSAQYYNWGNYPEGLYRYYQQPGEKHKIRTRLVQHIQALETSGALVPPGLYAEVGTYYLENGDSATAVEYYKKEHAAWPESRTLMSALIQNLEKAPSE